MRCVSKSHCYLWQLDRWSWGRDINFCGHQWQTGVLDQIPQKQTLRWGFVYSDLSKNDSQRKEVEERGTERQRRGGDLARLPFYARSYGHWLLSDSAGSTLVCGKVCLRVTQTQGKKVELSSDLSVIALVQCVLQT